MMDYIKRHWDGVLVCSEGKDVILKMGIKKYLNDLCLANLATFDGRKKAISRLLKQKNNLPIYINDELFVYPTTSLRDYNTVFINYHQVLSYKQLTNKKTKFIFNNLNELVVDVDVNRVNKQHQRIASIIQYLEDIP